MAYFVGLDVGVAKTAICVLDERGERKLEAITESNPKAIAGALRGRRWRFALVVLETGGLSSWLHEGLSKLGFRVVCVETHHSSAVLKTRTNKTDRNDALGLAELARNRHFRAVHVKSTNSQMVRTHLGARKVALRKLVDIEAAIRGLLLPFGVKVPALQRNRYVAEVRVKIRSNKALRRVLHPLLGIHQTLCEVVAHYEAELKALANEDPVCTRLMTAPGVGPMVALIYRTAIDDPARFARSRDVGPFLGLTPKVQQSGVTAWRSRISKAGDGEVRQALYMAAFYILLRCKRECTLTAWGRAIRARSGVRKALIAIMRRLAVILHRMWMDQTDFRWDAPEASGSVS